MTELEKEAFVKSMKNFIRNNYNESVATDMCNKLDYAKNRADTFERIVNLYQNSCRQFNIAYMNLFTNYLWE